MSFKEIKELRKQGKLDEALQMANQSLENDPENIWNKRAAGWVHYDYLKKYAKLDTFDDFKETLLKIKELELPEEEKMLFDNCAWQIGSLVFSIQKNNNVDYNKINDLFQIIQSFHFSKPSEAYTFIYKAFHKGYQNWSKFIEFANWWDFENFGEKDFLKEEYNGKKIMAIVEQAYIAYSKKLLGGEQINPLNQQIEVDENKIQIFIPHLDNIIDSNPEYQYPPYFKAKLLLALGNEENILSTFLPFAKQKRNDFWVWELIAEIFSEDEAIQFACYCKALSLKTPEDFLVKIREIFAEKLINKQMYEEAKTEIEKIIKTRKKHEWNISNKINNWINQEWYISCNSKNDNKELYNKHVKIAEEILYQDINEEIVVVEFVNKNKNMLNFVKNNQKYGFFNFSRQLDNPKIGDIIKVRFNGDGQDGFYKIYTAKKAEAEKKSEAIKKINGKLKIISPQNFGFIDDVFIDTKLIQIHNLSEGQNVKGSAILSFNKKKKVWGWKAIIIN